MSIKIMSMVWEHYPAGGGDLLMALACADHAHDDGTNVRPSVMHLAQKTRQSPRTVQRQLAQMRESGWLILVRNGRGGRGHTAEYRINPLWITNPVNLTPFAGLGAERVTSEALKGDTGGIKRVSPVSPQPPITVIESTTTAPTEFIEPGFEAVEPVDNLVWPRLMTSAERAAGARLLAMCPADSRQAVLDEVAGLADRGAVRHPMGLLSKLVEAAQRGRFIPAAGLEWTPKRLAMARAVKEREREAQERKAAQADAGDPALREAARAKIAALAQQMRLTGVNRGPGNTRGA